MTKVGVRFGVIAAVAFFAALAGMVLQHYSRDARADAVRELRTHPWPDPQGQVQTFSQWGDKVLVVNFWATWCEPCRKEVPELVRTQARLAANGVQIVGIGIDSADNIREFAKEYQINYPLAVAGLEAIDLVRRLGNGQGALPYTVVIDRRGQLAASHLGGLSEQALDDLLRPLL